MDVTTARPVHLIPIRPGNSFARPPLLCYDGGVTDSGKSFQRGIASRLRGAASWCVRGRRRGVLFFLFAMSPGILTAVLIAGHAVNIPVWDGWERGVLLKHARSGTLDAGYLTSTHIDHRPIIPRLLLLASNSLSGGDLRFENWIGFLAVLAGALGLLWVLRQTLSTAPPVWLWTTVFLVNLVLFSPLQYQNFLWAVQLAILLPLGCLGLLVAVLCTRWRLPLKVAAAAVLAEVATLCFGHGLVLWPVAICAVLLSRDHAMRARVVSVVALSALAALTVYGYFNWNYVNTSQPQHAYGALPGESPVTPDRLAIFRENPERVARYFWSSLGNPMARFIHSDPLAVSVDAGRWSLMLFTAGVLWWLWRWREEKHWQALLPWAAVGMFAVLCAALLSSGRGAHLPFERSLMPRYLSLTMYLWVAIVVFASYLLNHYRQHPSAGPTATRLALILAAGFAALQSQQWVYGAHKCDAWKSARLQERFQLLYVNQVAPRLPAMIDSVNATAFALAQARYLDDEGLMRPAFFKAKGFGDFTLSSQRGRLKRSDLMSAKLSSIDTLHVRGFASLEDGRAGDGLVVTWRIAGSGSRAPVITKDSAVERQIGQDYATADWQFLDLVEIQSTSAMRASFYDLQFGGNLRNLSKLMHWARFERTLDISALPTAEEVEIVLWVADTEHMVVSPLKRSIRLTRGESSPGEILIEAK